MGRSMIIINSAAIMDELDKRGALYSDRPVLQMGGELVGYNNTLVLLRYGPRFRTFRKHFSSIIGPIPLEDQKRTIALHSHHFLKRVLARPEDILPHLRKYGTFLFITNKCLKKTQIGRRNHLVAHVWNRSARRRGPFCEPNRESEPEL
jgi:hypothetical protein